MCTRKLSLQIISLVLTLWLLAGCESAPVEPAKALPPPVRPTSVATVVANPTVAAPQTTATQALPPSTLPPQSQATSVKAQATPLPVTRIQFQPNSTSWYTPGDLEPNASIRFVLGAQKGQQMTVNLTTEPATASTNTYGALYITAADGTVFTPNPTTKWTGTLSATQDYYIEVRSMSQNKIGYTVSVAIPPLTQPAATRIQFQPNTTSWQTSGNIAPNATMIFVLSARQGQQMNINLTTEPSSSVTPYVVLSISGADGLIYTFTPTTSWNTVLSTSQDYYITVISLSQQSVKYTLSVAIPAAGSVAIPTTNPSALKYVPVTSAVCKIIQELATQSVALTFSMEADATFADPLTGEKGRGCTLTAMATGMKFSDPASVKSTLVKGLLGWTEQTKYQADGPTGSASAVTRDMALALINVVWIASPDAKCPTNQPISACNLKPEQKLYTIQIQTAMK